MTSRAISRKTVVELDLKEYSDTARVIEENLSAEVVMILNEQIQGLVDSALAVVGISRTQAVMATTGDGAILAFDDPIVAHDFGEALHRACVVHNYGKTIEMARRWFRVGMATGDLCLETDGTTRRMAGSVIARAVRLEAAASVGEIVADSQTLAVLPAYIQAFYGKEELVYGKRDEEFPAHRYAVVNGMTTRQQKVKPSSASQKTGNPLSLWQERLGYLQEQLAIASNPAMRFEIKKQIDEAQNMVQELSG